MIKKSIEELVCVNENTWEFIQSWLSNSSINYEVLNTSKEKAECTLHDLQITTKSTLGAIAYKTGGILVDHGWLKLLGSGNEKIFGDLSYWNCVNNISSIKKINNLMIIAYDVIGGFFAINGGAFEGKTGNIFYLPPDTLEWEDMTVGYTDFLIWILDGNLNAFYDGLRWDGWISDMSALPHDKGFNFYPPLRSEQGSVEASSRKTVPVKELWELNLDYIDKLK